MDQITQVGQKIRRFYEKNPFPGYEEFETPFDLIEKSKKGIFANLLDQQLPLGVSVLDAGCGTGQLSIFLSLSHRYVIGADLSFQSLKKADDFKNRFHLKDVAFIQMDLFHPSLKEGTLDYIFCNGVLHHTADAEYAFSKLCRLLKPGGYIFVGLYNTYGRFFTNCRRLIFNLTGERGTFLDYFLRQRSLGKEKKRIWYMDQYRNPHEKTFTVDTVLNWFLKNDILYVRSIPRIQVTGTNNSGSNLFLEESSGIKLEHLICQLGWIFSQQREGGLFITVGKKGGKHA